MFNAEIQDGRQKWRENIFCKESPLDSADTLRGKNFVEIALSRSVIEINVFLRLTQKFKMAAGKRFLQKVVSRFYRYPVGQNFRQNCSISLRFRDKCVFRKIVTFTKSSISRSLCIGSLPKVNDFQKSI